MISCTYPGCCNEATHILVDYSNEAIEPHEVFCDEHAFEDEREQCCCYPDAWHFYVEDDDGETIELRLELTYSVGTLDSKRCCRHHP
ncbi:hypothetical protein B0F87_10388 [Methylobacter tundripaludum]|uniref:Uncharacterized protein n=1 Tax=Methylobacter tundripaludum TaxID=173365 RepID=A0A2S6HGI1_9GAMM|nr:hypothetical protein B0F87_10388 [Methylobacter tundripaludum]